MTLDLSRLETAVQLGKQFQDAAASLVVSIELVHEDPDQPRKSFDQAPLEELAADIAQRGILQPIVVRPMENGKYRILFGARRYRAALLARLKDLPLFVASDARQFDSYAQVSENRQRLSLSPMEEALFIKSKLDVGDKRKEIAEKMGVSASAVTMLCALIDPPGVVLELYESGKCRSPEYLYRIRSLYETNPQLVLAKVNDAGEINRTFIDELTAILKPTIEPPTPKPGPSSDPGLGSVAQQTHPPRLRDDERANYQIIMIKHSGRPARLILTRRVSAAGLGWIKYLDDNQETEVVLTECVIDLLLEK